MAIPEKGYLYIAAGEQYIKEAIVSAESLRKVDSLAHITLITDQRINCPLFDLIILKPSIPIIKNPKWGENERIKKSMKSFKSLHMYDSPYKKTFFIDTDTYFCENCRELFELLDYSDICLSPSGCFYFPVTVNSKLLKGINSYSSGVVVFKKSLRNKFFFKKWAENYVKIDDFYMDQQALMNVIIRSRLKIAYISNIYNTPIFIFVSLPPLKVKLLHGRNYDFKKVESVINSVLEKRCWDPVKQKILVSKPISNFFPDEKFNF